MTPSRPCRFCSTQLEHSFCDLGMSPMSNEYLSRQDLQLPEKFYPLHAYVCAQCFLVQLEDFETPELIFGDYAYFSSYSQSWLDHARAYCDVMTARLGLTARHQVVEIASNDGYLLKNFIARNIPVLGIEPAANVARVAQNNGIPTRVNFFGAQFAHELKSEGVQADLLIANNVLAHVPDLNDFVAGMKILLKPGGLITLEFPHLLRLMAENQFDTIYHEHFSYFSLITVDRIFSKHGLAIVDVDSLSTHGGSIRIHAVHTGASARPVSLAVGQLKSMELQAGLQTLQAYAAFAAQVRLTKRRLLAFLIDVKNAGKSIVGYGAPAKGNTLLNYCGIRRDFIDYTVDLSPHKQGKFLPGTHIPVYAPEKIRDTQPDYVLVLPWNIKDEIMAQMSYIREWGGQFVLPIPEVRVVP